MQEPGRPGPLKIGCAIAQQGDLFGAAGHLPKDNMVQHHPSMCEDSLPPFSLIPCLGVPMEILDRRGP